MPAEEPQSATGNREAASDAFYSGAYGRILRFMLAAAAVALAALWWRLGRGFALAFLAGCLIAAINFYWLKRTVEALADRVTGSGQPQSGKGIVARFLLRYFLIALGAYVIFKISEASVYGLLAGLFLPVAGILCEAAYEVVVSVRRGY